MAENILDTMQTELKELQQRIDAAQTIALFGHQNIDGDAMGSILGFGSILEKFGKMCSYFTPLAPSRYLAFVPGVEKIQTTFDYGAYDLLIFLDFTPYDRIQWFTKDHESYFDTHEKIVIDHHLDAKVRGNLQLKDTRSSSNCGWLYEICSRIWPEHIDSTIATYFMMGLTTDTGNFMRGASPQRDFMIAWELLAAGANREFINRNLFFSTRPEVLGMGKLIFERTTTLEHTLFTRYTKEELAQHNVDDDEAEWFQMPLRSIAWYPVYLRLRYMGEYRAGSLRSGYPTTGERISVQKIALSFGGGGHMYAAGFSTPSDWWLSIEEDARRIVGIVNDEVEKQLTLSQ
jgi:bifunctional oligoribonuclease and PAP phosphatase NrnA